MKNESLKTVGGVYKPIPVTFPKFKRIVKKHEGIVFLGAGGNQDEWVKGVSQLLKDEGIADSGEPGDIFMGAYKLTTSGGRTDLALVFNTKKSVLSMGKMAMWRIRFGDASWISDYIDNYAHQHEESVNTEEDDVALILENAGFVEEAPKELKKITESKGNSMITVGSDIRVTEGVYAGKEGKVESIGILEDGTFSVAVAGIQESLTADMIENANEVGVDYGALKASILGMDDKQRAELYDALGVVPKPTEIDDKISEKAVGEGDEEEDEKPAGDDEDEVSSDEEEEDEVSSDGEEEGEEDEVSLDGEDEDEEDEEVEECEDEDEEDESKKESRIASLLRTESKRLPSNRGISRLLK